MAIDLDKMRKKLSALKNKGGGNFWKPPEGKSTIRILPTEDGDPFKAFHFHYNLGKHGFLCPKKNYGDDCPACNFVKDLYAEGDDESKAMAKDLSARQRFFSPILVRGKESEGVKIWGYSKTVYEELLSLVLNPDYGDITDPSEGVDLQITYGKEDGARYPSTKIDPRRKSSEMCADMSEGECDSLLESIPDFDTLYEKVSTAEVQKMLDEHLSADDEEDGSGGTEKYGASNTSSVDSAFEALAGS